MKRDKTDLRASESRSNEPEKEEKLWAEEVDPEQNQDYPNIAEQRYIHKDSIETTRMF